MRVKHGSRTFLILLVLVHGILCFFSSPCCSPSRATTCRVFPASPDTLEEVPQPRESNAEVPRRLLFHWKGEGVEGYSLQFRHAEFQGALEAVVGSTVPSPSFRDALEYTGDAYMAPVKLRLYNAAMQWVESEVPINAVLRAAERCSLIHAVYSVAATSSTGNVSELAQQAMDANAFVDMEPGQSNEKASWCVRVRHYGDDRRHGARSITREKQALLDLKPLLLTFGGGVDLKGPDCKIYVMDGLIDGAVLTRRVARGARCSILAPNTRICVTNTPLEPIAACSMINLARITPEMRVLDLYCGSGTLLLAASWLAPGCRTYGIEIAHNGLVNRDDIVRDFETRGLMPPELLLKGDSTDPEVRALVRGDEPFDAIVTDPPYGIRESNAALLDPLEDIMEGLIHDRGAGRPLLKVGGRLVCFVPCTDEQNIQEIIPPASRHRQAGLDFEWMREQPLNERLSRWMIVYKCVENGRG